MQLPWLLRKFWQSDWTTDQPTDQQNNRPRKYCHVYIYRGQIIYSLSFLRPSFGNVYTYIPKQLHPDAKPIIRPANVNDVRTTETGGKMNPLHSRDIPMKSSGWIMDFPPGPVLFTHLYWILLILTNTRLDVYLLSSQVVLQVFHSNKKKRYWKICKDLFFHKAKSVVPFLFCLDTYRLRF